MEESINELIESAKKVPNIHRCKELIVFEGNEATGEKDEKKVKKSAFLWETVIHIYETEFDLHDGPATGVMFDNGKVIVLDSDFNTLFNIWALWKQQQA